MEYKEYKCPICGKKYKAIPSLELDRYFDKCELCDETFKLQNVIINYWNKIKQKIIKELNKYNLTNYKIKYEYSCEGRTNKVKDLIDRINEPRNLLYFDLAPQIKILDSVLNANHIFWNEGGNLKIYIFQSTLEYVVTKLKEIYNGSESKVSIKKILTMLKDVKKDAFIKQKIYCNVKIKSNNSDNLFEIDKFPIDDYIEAINNLLDSYKNIISVIEKVRNNVCAHFNKDDEALKLLEIRLPDIKRLFNSFRIIYDGLLLGIAPDLYKDIEFFDELHFERLNNIVYFYRNNKIGGN